MFRTISTLLAMLALLVSTSSIQTLMCRPAIENCETSAHDLCDEDAALHTAFITLDECQDRSPPSTEDGCCCTIHPSDIPRSSTAAPLLPGYAQTKVFVEPGMDSDICKWYANKAFIPNLNYASHPFPPKLYRLYASYLI